MVQCIKHNNLRQRNKFSLEFNKNLFVFLVQDIKLVSRAVELELHGVELLYYGVRDLLVVMLQLILFLA